jgi:hypothetical protein
MKPILETARKDVEERRKLQEAFELKQKEAEKVALKMISQTLQDLLHKFPLGNDNTKGIYTLQFPVLLAAADSNAKILKVHLQKYIEILNLHYGGAWEWIELSAEQNHLQTDEHRMGRGESAVVSECDHIAVATFCYRDLFSLYF